MKNYITQTMICLEENLVTSTMKDHHIKQIIFDIEDPLRYAGSIQRAIIKDDRLVFINENGDLRLVDPRFSEYYFWCRDAYNKLLATLKEINS